MIHPDNVIQTTCYPYSFSCFFRHDVRTGKEKSSACNFLRTSPTSFPDAPPNGSDRDQETGRDRCWSNGRLDHKPSCQLLVYIMRNQGLGIALVAAQKAEVDVHLIDSSQSSLDKGLAFAGTIDSVSDLKPYI